MILKTILKINPNAKVSVKGDDIDTCQIEWGDGTTPISKDDIRAQLPSALDNALDNLRIERNNKLKDTDFYALSDVTMSSEMTTYRQALRDLPSNYTTSDSSTLTEDLSNLVWPTKP
ncbi:putative tail assembly chaperone [Pelagibacter phage Mosig EXVC030M]|nr:putative tail assembly chaperone [Pelagibacter phage Mosig EXVC030M]